MIGTDTDAALARILEDGRRRAAAINPRLSGSGATSAPTYGLLVSMNRGAGWPVYLV